MKVLLTTDGRDFDDEGVKYEPGDVAWFEEDVLLVVKIEGDTAHAIVHPAAREMMHAALYSHAGMPNRAAAGLAEAMRVHARTMARGYLAALGASLSMSCDVPDKWTVTMDAVSIEAIDRVRDEVEKAQEIVKPTSRKRSP